MLARGDPPGVSVALGTLTERLPPSRLGEARATLTLAIIAGLVWGVVLPLQIATALG